MSESTSQWRPDWAVPPGEVLHEILQSRGMSQAELARRMARPLKTINEIVKGKAAITADTAVQLELALGIDMRIWTNLDARFREHEAITRSSHSMKENVDWLKKFPVDELAQEGLVEADGRPERTLESLLRFFGVSSPAGWESQWMAGSVAFRASDTFTASPEATSAWLRWGELEAQKIDLEPYDKAGFKRTLEKVRTLTRKQPLALMMQRTKKLCAAEGVAFVVCPTFKGVRASGASYWVGTNSPVLQLSLRYKSEEQLWFSFFHEAGHIVEGHKKGFIDGEISQTDDEDEMERQANRFARDLLLPPRELASFIEAGDLSAAAVQAFAKTLGVSPGIVVGRLQHDGHLDYNQLAQFRRPIHLA
ncbi:MAG: HigA family addiction module antitoxin [Actinomycetota bacterium]